MVAVEDAVDAAPLNEEVLIALPQESVEAGTWCEEAVMAPEVAVAQVVEDEAPLPASVVFDTKNQNEAKGVPRSAWPTNSLRLKPTRFRTEAVMFAKEAWNVSGTANCSGCLYSRRV